VRREHAVVEHQVDAGTGRERRELLQQLDGLEQQVGGSVAPFGFQGQEHPAVGGARQPVLRMIHAQHVKMVPGRKPDVRDSERLAQLLELGLLRRSFVPPAAQRELRDVVRYRAGLSGATAQRHRHAVCAAVGGKRHPGRAVLHRARGVVDPHRWTPANRPKRPSCAGFGCVQSARIASMKSSPRALGR
jgi:hypothetical protein